MKTLPDWLRCHLENPPPQKTGLHRWIYRTVCLLAEHGIRDGETLCRIMQHATASAGRDTTREIADAVDSVLSGGAKRHRHPSWPKRDAAAIAEVLKNGISESKLHALSPAPCCESSREILPLLFPGDPLLCLGFSNSKFHTRPLTDWLGIMKSRNGQFIVPSPLTSVFGTTVAGKTTDQSNANTGAREYLVIEFDFNPKEKEEDADLLAFGGQFGLTSTRDLCASIAFHLGQRAPLALVVFSGGKSLHCWFPVRGLPEENQREFFAYACRLGADPVTWTPSQFVRLPRGRNRDKQQTQTVIYFDHTLCPQTPNTKHHAQP